jgi:hypothetical protein
MEKDVIKDLKDFLKEQELEVNEASRKISQELKYDIVKEKQFVDTFKSTLRRGSPIKKIKEYLEILKNSKEIPSRGYQTTRNPNSKVIPIEITQFLRDEGDKFAREIKRRGNL